MDIRKVKKLMELLEESGMAEIEIKEGEESVKISRFGSSPAPLQSPVQSFIQQQPVANSAPVATTSAEPAERHERLHNVPDRQPQGLALGK